MCSLVQVIMKTLEHVNVFTALMTKMKARNINYGLNVLQYILKTWYNYY